MTARWPAGDQTWTQTRTLQSDQRDVKVFSPTKSQNKLCRIWILFRSVGDAELRQAINYFNSYTPGWEYWTTVIPYIVIEIKWYRQLKLLLATTSSILAVLYSEARVGLPQGQKNWNATFNNNRLFPNATSQILQHWKHAIISSPLNEQELTKISKIVSDISYKTNTSIILRFAAAARISCCAQSIEFF